MRRKRPYKTARVGLRETWWFHMIMVDGHLVPCLALLPASSQLSLLLYDFYFDPHATRVTFSMSVICRR